MILTTINVKTAELRNRTEPTMKGVLDILAAEYPQLYLNPDADTQETYRRVVLQGEEPEERSLGHYVGDQHDHMETVDTPAGPVHVVTLGSRRDFELVLRGLTSFYRMDLNCAGGRGFPLLCAIPILATRTFSTGRITAWCIGSTESTTSKRKA